MRVNEVAAAIAGDRLAEASQALARLQAEVPDHAGVGPASARVAALRTRAATPFGDANEALAAATAIGSWRHQPQPLLAGG